MERGSLCTNNRTNQIQILGIHDGVIQFDEFGMRHIVEERQLVRERLFSVSAFSLIHDVAQWVEK